MQTNAAPKYLITRTGLKLLVRPVAVRDEVALAALFRDVREEDLRFRFLATLKRVSEERIRSMAQVDHSQTENFLAFAEDGQLLIASAMVAFDAGCTEAEVAIAVHRDFKGRGVAWELLRHASDYAQARGVKSIQSVEARENHEAIELEQEQGFMLVPHPGDPSMLILRKDFV